MCAIAAGFLTGVLMGVPAGAATADASVTLDRIEVTATRVPRSVLEVPASISVVQGKEFVTDSPGVNLSEKLTAVPGVLARDRQNYAQDEQISIRGFGARSTFGIRGVRLYVDGVPASMPDGQGQVSNFNLASADRVEVLRGPFSALYGNASGGVIQLFTADGQSPSQWRVGSSYGSFASWRQSAGVRGGVDRLDYNADLTHFATQGFRDHSRARRESGNAKFNIAIGDTGKLSLLMNGFSSPGTQDPLGLTRMEFAADPSQATPAARLFDTRKSVNQQQIGAIFQATPSANQSVRVLAYAGQRRVEQFLAVPVAAQRNPLSGGGVIALSTPFGGADAQWVYRGQLASEPLEFVAGLSYDRQNQHRRAYENFVGNTLGVRGALRRDEHDRVHDFDQYAQLTWRPGDAWSIVGGVRHSVVRFSSRDHYITAGNPDDGGHLRFAATTPMLGVTWRPAAALHVYAAYGLGFETPTFDELGYRADGSSGLNLALQPARTRSGEIGAKLVTGGLRADVALFRADTRDELAVATSAAGRTTFQNAGQARRQGFELAASAPLGGRWRGRVAYTWLDARFHEGFRTCVSTPCLSPDTLVAGGTRIPGVPRSVLFVAANWGDEAGWHTQLDGQYVGSVSVNNLDSQRAGGYATMGASAGYGFDRGRRQGRAFLGVANLLDRRYAGSVIVNETNGRYFEPAPGRTLFAGLELRWSD